MDFHDIVDFVVEVEEDRDVKILQLTDFQPIDCSQQRYEGRLNGFPFSSPFNEQDRYNGVYKYVDELVKRTNPDLIIITGDNVYGEFDDNGVNQISFINKMDSYNIPWAPVFGNHDNESKKGVTWQCEQFLKAKNCLFKRRNLTGNGNYNIGIVSKGKLIKVIYMLDSNGCGHAYNFYGYKKDYPLYNQNEKVETRPLIGHDQISWINESASLIDKYYPVSKFIAMHIVPEFGMDQCKKNGYLVDRMDHFDLDSDVAPINGDFGHKRENFCSCETYDLMNVLKEHNFDGMFVGHDHVNTCSILCDGFLRLTFGVKTGTFDYHDDIGGTLININQNSFKIEHIFLEK